MEAIKRWKLVAWQAPIQNAFLVLPAPFAPPPCSTRTGQSPDLGTTETSELHIFYFSVLNLTCPSFHLKQRKRQDSYQSTEQQFWTWGPWWGSRGLTGALKLHAGFVPTHLLCISLVKASIASSQTQIHPWCVKSLRTTALVSELKYITRPKLLLSEG